MFYCLHDKGDVIVGFERMFPRDVLYIFEVKQAVKILFMCPYIHKAF